MKRGYSLKSARTVDACHLAYDDCRDDRVVCEICRERVFKVERRRGEGSIHYLSHYMRTDATRECEARLARRIEMERTEQPCPQDAVSRGQGIRERVEALSRILAVQFPRVADTSTAMAHRAEQFTSKYKGGMHIPSIVAMYSMLATMFQFAARMKGHAVMRSDLTMDIYEDRWVEYVTGMNRMGLQAASRTGDDVPAMQRQWMRDMVDLLCQRQSQDALLMLVRHAWADIAMTGIPSGVPHGEETGRRMREIARKIVSKDARALDETLPTAGPMAKDGTYFHVAAPAVVARMQDILLEIDYEAPVPAAGSIEVFRQVALTSNSVTMKRNDLPRARRRRFGA